MCGICGFWGFADNNLMNRMLIKLEHRGPDGAGSYVSPCGQMSLGHRRLSIIDLTDRASQPIKGADGNAVLVFNGEIYNYKHLKLELQGLGYTFNSDSDSEVLMVAYREWGVDCLHRFRGMFAFAIWDEAKKMLFCARDRFGIKPFYYYTNGGKGVFASEIKAILEHEEYKPAVNLSIAYDYLKRGLLEHTDETFFTGINKLPAAHYMTVLNGVINIKRYWDLPNDGVQPQCDEETAVQSFREHFLNALKEHVVADVSVGSCLSGGLDSSTIVSAVVSENLLEKEKFETFSYVSKIAEHDESRFIDECVSQNHVVNHKVLIEPNEISKMLENIVYHQEEPFGSTSIFLQWAVMKKAHEQGVKVLLDGQGADEILAGYRKYRLYKMREFARGGKYISALGLLFSSLGQFKTSLSLRNDFDKITRIIFKKAPARADYINIKLSPSHYHVIHSEIADVRQASRYDLTKISLPSLLRYEDKNSMAHSIEARVPFLDHELVEYVFALPSEFKLRKGVSKWVMRSAFSKELPTAIRNRKDKMGFVPSEDLWISENRRYFVGILEKNCERLAPYINVPELLKDQDKLFDAPLDSNLWRYINFAVWFEMFICRGNE